MTKEYIKTLHIAMNPELILKIKRHSMMNRVNEITNQLWAEFLEDLEMKR